MQVSEPLRSAHRWSCEQLILLLHYIRRRGRHGGSSTTTNIVRCSKPDGAQFSRQTIFPGHDPSPLRARLASYVMRAGVVTRVEFRCAKNGFESRRSIVRKKPVVAPGTASSSELRRTNQPEAKMVMLYDMIFCLLRQTIFIFSELFCITMPCH